MNKLFLYLAFCVLLADIEAFAQSGCTDPLASNYNSGATINDGSCIYSSASVVPDTSFTLSTTIQETSGLIFWDHYVWTHNDNTDLNLYSLDTLSGAITQTYTLSGVVNNDWEEISQDDSYIYLGDFGNNANGNRTDLKILRIEKNSILFNAPDIDTISFSYSNQTDFSPTGSCSTDFDCEAFIVSSDSIFLFTKQWIGKQTSVYSLPKTPGTYTAVLKTTYNISGLITGATYLQSKQLVVLCGYSNTLQPFTFLLYDFNGYNFFGGNKRKIAISLSLHQIEGVTTHDGLIYYYSNELFSRFKIITNEQKLHIVDLSLYLSNYINGSSATINENETENTGQIMIYPNPGKEVISVKLNNTNTTKNYFISDITGKIVLSGQLQNDSSNINVKKLKKGSYILKIGNNSVFKWVKE